MKKSLLTLALILLATTALAAPQTSCPVMGGKINPKQYADVEGYRIYVCCKPCVKKVKADPQTYIDKLKAAGVELEKTPTPTK